MWSWQPAKSAADIQCIFFSVAVETSENSAIDFFNMLSVVALFRLILVLAFRPRD